MAEKLVDYSKAWRDAHNLLAKYRTDFDAAIATLKMAADAEEFLASNAKAIKAQQESMARTAVEAQKERDKLNVVKSEQRDALASHNRVIEEKIKRASELDKQISQLNTTLTNTRWVSDNEVRALNQSKADATTALTAVEAQLASRKRELNDTLTRLQRAQATLAG